MEAEGARDRELPCAQPLLADLTSVFSRPLRSQARFLAVADHHPTLPLLAHRGQRINEKATVINEYESGKAIPNPVITSKIERALGVRLPRPPKKGKK